MTLHAPRPAGLAFSLFLVGSAVTAIAAVIDAVDRPPVTRHAEPEIVTVAMLAPPAEAIGAEAEVFRTRADMMAIDPGTRRERAAHQRTLKTFRYLRAYPGAPPRIPHGLTPDEFRTGACRTCHERGGYSLRFAAYVPVTPHSEMGPCLQCHVGDGGITGISRPSSDPNSRCPTCHGSGGTPRADASATLNWRTTAWPQLPRPIPDRSPPSIPHDLQLRGNCIACHTGPAAVAEIRTSHPERADCRQCHLTTDGEVGAFARADPDVPVGTEGAP